MKNKLAAFLATIFLLFLHVGAQGAADRVCTYVNGTTTVSAGFADCTVEVAKVFERGKIPTTGAAGTDTYSASSSPAVITLVDGLTVEVEIPNTNTGAATFNLDSTGAVAIKDYSGAAMAAGVSSCVAAGGAEDA